jgi:hypothetical protein
MQTSLMAFSFLVLLRYRKTIHYKAAVCGYA